MGSERSTWDGSSVFPWQENDTRLNGKQCSGGDYVDGRSSSA